MVRWRPVGAVVAFVLSGCAIGSAAKSPVPADRPTSPPLVITVTGTADASNITFYIDNRRLSHAGPVTLPYAYTDMNLDDIDGAYPVTAAARDSSGSATARITCQIVESGVNVARVTVEGPHGLASCSDHQPQDPLRTSATTRWPPWPTGAPLF